MAFPGVELCPAVPELPDGAALAPDGELCATTQTVQHRITNSNVSFFIDFMDVYLGCLSYLRNFHSRHVYCLYVDSSLKYFDFALEGISG